MAKVKTTNRRVQNLMTALTALIGQDKINPLFALRLSGIKFKIEKLCEAVELAIGKLDDQSILRDGRGQKVAILDDQKQPIPGRFQVDPTKSKEYAEGKKAILDKSVSFRAPTVPLSHLVDNWVDSEESEDDEGTGFVVPGWVVSSFFDVGLLDLDVEEKEVAFLKGLLDEDDDEDEVEGPVIPGGVTKAPEKKKTSRAK